MPHEARGGHLARLGSEGWVGGWGGLDNPGRPLHDPIIAVAIDHGWGPAGRVVVWTEAAARCWWRLSRHHPLGIMRGGGGGERFDAAAAARRGRQRAQPTAP